MPTPRNESVASPMIAAATPNVATMMAGVDHVRQDVAEQDERVLAPMARAAITYS